jgi:uncharacterized protein (DUF427 family)
MRNYPAQIVSVNHVEPVPRRVRAFLNGAKVLDSTNVRYVWETARYPHYYIPAEDVRADVLVPEGDTQSTRRGTAELFGLRVGDAKRLHAVKSYPQSPVTGIAGTMRFEWDALDAWFEEDEQVFVHPRDPYVRVDAIRSTRQIRIEFGGVVLAQSSSPVMVFETGLPTRYYLDRTTVDLDQLIPSDTVTACPYKGSTSGYWSARNGENVEPDIAWAYDFPSHQLLPIAGLIAFYNEKVEICIDGELLPPHEAPVRHLRPA